MNKEYVSINIWPSGWQNKTFCKRDKIIWFMHGEINALMKCDLETGNTSYVGTVEGEKLIGKYLYSQIVQYKDKLYLIPKKANRLAVYDIILGEFNYIKNWEKTDIRCAFNVGEYIYLIPTFCNKSILLLNADSLKIEKSISLQQLENIQNNMVGTNCAFDGRNMYIPTYDHNKKAGSVIKLDSKDNSIELIFENVEGWGFDSIAILQDKIYLSSYDEKIYIADKQTHHVTDKLEGLGAATLILGSIQNKILVDSFETEYVYVINELSKLDILFKKYLGGNVDNCIKSGQIGAFDFYETFGIYFCRDTYSINIIDDEGKIIKSVVPTLDTADVKVLSDKWFADADDILKENSVFTLQGMIQGLIDGGTLKA